MEKEKEKLKIDFDQLNSENLKNKEEKNKVDQLQKKFDEINKKKMKKKKVLN